MAKLATFTMNYTVTNIIFTGKIGIKSYIETLRLCLVFGKFEGKCKGQKIERKSEEK